MTTIDIDQDRLPTTESIMNNPTVSYFVKNALREAKHRDDLDALRDAELVAAILQRDYREAHSA